MSAQLNPYKYVIVPVQFEAFDKPNKYSSSTLVKYLLQQDGFKAVYDNDLPADLAGNQCLGVNMHLEDNSGLFSTKLRFIFKDCNGAEVFATKMASNKIKEYQEAYTEAIREALRSLSVLGYTYEPAAGTQDKGITVSFKDDVRNIEETERKPLKEKPVIQEATPEVQRYEDKRPVPSTYTKPGGVSTGSSKEDGDITTEVLYAQSTDTGYQLVDSTPAIRVKLYKTSMPDVYLATYGELQGLVFERDGTWTWEYYLDGELVAKELQIKF
ncbi:hypothetical protein PP178_13880 [Zeaxanthinibacter sp. PT1]|uniref:hypothetical protein n=1 Tax=Zeaxanthinibacter TaxID=561554 RepID=UPI00234A2A91|nr:hypothetical protein [Zeaxanthinibacter sp. PT1]MDC6352647.1 hypothetical protein [Zeaxanthinibacter sp. PT1]